MSHDEALAPELPGNMDNNSVPPDLTEEELLERSFDLNKLFAISQIRESPHPQFDWMGYMKYNETNEMADISFIVPRKNKFDTRVTSGITHEKDTSILALVNGFNFEVNLSVFYKDQELPELGTSLTDWVRKSRELDNYDEKRPILYRNLIVQGTAFSCVQHVQQWTPNKVVTSKTNDYTDIDAFTWYEAGLVKQFEGCSTTHVDGKKVFLEDYYQQDIRKQVGIYTVEYIPRELVQSIWGQSQRWKNVPKKCAPNGTIGAMITQGSIYSDWFFLTLDFDKVEVIKAYRPMENRYQIYLNGIPMLHAGFPLTAISPSGLPNIAKGDLDPMNMCAYSKGIPAKTKMDQALYDALVRISLIKFEQSAFPPFGNNSGRMLSPDIFMPSKITRNLRAEDISVLTENVGLQPADFSFMEMIKTQIENKSVTSLLENGGQPAGDMTLGQYLDMQRRQLIKIGGIFDGVINWEKQMAHLIVADLLSNCGDKSDNVAVKSSFEDGAKGMRVLRFKKNNFKTSDQLHQEELNAQAQTGMDVRFSDLNPEVLRNMVNNPDYYFHYEIIPVDKNNDKVTQAMFIAMVTQAAQLFGPQSLKVQKLKEKYASVMGVSFDDIFLNDQEMNMNQQMNGPQVPGQMPGSGPQPGAVPSPMAPGISMPSAPVKQFQ